MNETPSILEGDIDHSRRLVREHERRLVEGRVFVFMRVESQLAGAAATAVIPGASHVTRADFMLAAEHAWDNAWSVFDNRVRAGVAQIEEALNPPPGIVDVG